MQIIMLHYITNPTLTKSSISIKRRFNVYFISDRLLYETSFVNYDSLAF